MAFFKVINLSGLPIIVRLNQTKLQLEFYDGLDYKKITQYKIDEFLNGVNGFILLDGITEKWNLTQDNVFQIRDWLLDNR